MPIEQHAPELERIIDLNAATEELAGGYGGDMGRLRARCGGRRADTSSSVIYTTTVA